MQALVLEAVYPTLREAVVNRIAIRLPFAEILAPLLLAQVEFRLGIDPDLIAPIEGIRQIEAPLLLIAGEQDRHTPLSESRHLFDAAPEPKVLWVVPGAVHQDFHRFDPAEYERRVLEFLARTVGESAAQRGAGAGTAQRVPIDSCYHSARTLGAQRPLAVLCRAG